MKQFRIRFVLVCLAALGFFASRAHADIVINEIMYNPPPSSGEDWLEIVNTGGAPVDITGYNFTQGITYTFPATTTIAAGEFIVVARDMAAFVAFYTGGDDCGCQVFQVVSGALSNGGDRTHRYQEA